MSGTADFAEHRGSFTRLAAVAAAPPALPRRASGDDQQAVTMRERLTQPVSLRLEMLLSLAVIGTIALMILVINLLLFDDLVGSPNGALYITLLVLADVTVFVAFGAAKLRSLVVTPLQEVVAAAQSIAAGDLSRRVPAGESTEFMELSRAINHMTVRLLEEQAHVARMEKMAGVGRLAAGVAHEIGNPLSAITGYTHLLRKSAAETPEVREALDGLQREAERVDRIVRGMLEYARPRQRSVVEVDVNTCVHKVVNMLGDQGVLRGLDVRLTLADRLPTLAGDRHEFEQVLVNLLLNAADAVDGHGSISIITRHVAFEDFARGAGVRREADTTDVAASRRENPRLGAWLHHAGEPEEVLQIVVTDSGPGIPDGDSERIFDPFFTTKEPGKGTGLGLAIVSRIVEGMGGAVWVRASREGGAAFVLLFAVRPTIERVR